jgi:hypothetical protein
MAFQYRTASLASRFNLASSRLDSKRGMSFLGDPGANVGDVTASDSFPKIYFIDKVSSLHKKLVSNGASS